MAIDDPERLSEDLSRTPAGIVFEKRINEKSLMTLPLELMNQIYIEFSVVGPSKGHLIKERIRDNPVRITAYARLKAAGLIRLEGDPEAYFLTPLGEAYDELLFPSDRERYDSCSLI